MPPQNLPVVDPNSELGRRLLGVQPRLSTPQARADALPDVGGMDTSDPAFQSLLRQQNAAALGSPPPGLLAAPGRRGEPGGPAPGTAFGNSAPLASATPAELAAGNVAVAPVPTQDPFRLNDPGLGPTPGRQDGDLFRYDTNDPRMRNPFMYDDGGTLRSSIQRGGMTADGFTPGFVNNGVGGSQAWASSAPDYLMAIQEAARARGVNPGQLADQFLGQLGSTADRSGRAAVGAQAANVNLAGSRLQADAQRYSADRSGEAQARAAALGAIPGFIAGLSGGNVPPPIAEMMGTNILQMLNGGPRAPGAAPGAGSAAPTTPGAPGVPALPGATGAAPGANPFAAAAASGDFLRPLVPVFGSRNAAGVVTAPEGFNMDAAAQQLLDRFHTGTPEQRAAAVAAVERGDLGNPQQVQEAIARRAAISTLRANGGLAPGQSVVGNMIGKGSLADQALTFLNWGDSPVPANARAPHVVVGPNGQPTLTFSEDPNQRAVAAGFGRLFSGGVGANQVTVPGFNPIPFDRTAVNGIGSRAGSTPEQDQRLAAAAQDFLQRTQRYQNATRR